MVTYIMVELKKWQMLHVTVDLNFNHYGRIK